jgi:hypothetical protein
LGHLVTVVTFVSSGYLVSFVIFVIFVLEREFSAREEA